MLSISSAVQGREIFVSNVSQLKIAIQNIQPGDTISVSDGSYDFNGNLSITKSGTSENPVLIRARNRHQAILINNSYFTLKQVSYIIIEGFLFRSKDVTAIKTESCNNIRITRNIFRLEETTSNKWVLIGGTWNLTEPNSHHNRIDHNLFEEKHQLGNYITIDGSPDPNAKSSRYDLIDHNHFRNIGPRAQNEMEAIRVGWSEMSLSSGFTTIEYNLFENCDGDPEIISVKTCDNIIRYNTFKSSQGTVCLRHGNRNTVKGNFFLGEGKDGTGGIRIYSDDHKIINNYFENLTGDVWDAALTITNGDADYSSSSNLSKNFRPRNSEVLFNTFVNNRHNIEIGYTNNGSYSRAPSGITIANNLVRGSENQLVKVITNPINFSWLGNIMFPQSPAVLGISASSGQIKIINPFLVQSGIWRLTSESPAIDSSAGNFSLILYDIDGQARDNYKDVGADEFSDHPIVLKPLEPHDVGPAGGDIALPVELTSFIGEAAENGIYLKWTTASEINNHGFEVQRSSDIYDWKVVGFISGAGSSSEKNEYEFFDKYFPTEICYYRLKQMDFDGSFEYSNTLEIAKNFIIDFLLGQNYPNPFNPETIIDYSLPQKSHVKINIFNSLGKEMDLLVDEIQVAGSYKVKFRPSKRYASGMYIYSARLGEKTMTKKMIFLK